MDTLYDLPLYRPPSEGDNLIIQATLGCSFNQCSFCAMYRDKRYTERPLERVRAEIREAARDGPDARRVFLADGDALALPSDHLLALLGELAAALPRLARVSCYATPANLLRKSAEELRTLRAAGLSLLYLGLESGSDLILKKVTKGATQRGMTEALHKARDAGLKVSATVILGLGGRRYAAEHIDGTVALLNQAPVNQLSTLQLYLDEAVAAEFRGKFGESYEPADDTAILREQERLLTGLRPPRPLVFRSNHASNALALEGALPRDRERLLAEVRAALAGERALRPVAARGM